MEIWYRFNYMAWMSKPRIEPVKVEKSTASTIWIDGRQHRIKSDYDNFFPTYEEAKAFGVDKYSRKVSSLKTKLQSAEEELQEIENL